MSLRALCLLRDSIVYRRDAFRHGLKLAGYQLVDKIDRPQPHDVVCIWNRYGHWHEQANRFEAAGARVIVAENGYLGKDWQGDTWFALALGHHAGRGRWNVGGPERWDDMGEELQPWRTGGRETVILGQRSIGEPGIASPAGWEERTRARIGGRIRQHPDKHAGPRLYEDLQHASAVATWASSAALRALIMGVPVWYGLPGWIGAEAARPVAEFGREPKRDDAARLAMFRRLAYAQWRLTEIADGTAFRHLLSL